MNENVTAQDCCIAWGKAQTFGTDSEAYGSLLRDYANPQRHRGVVMRPPDWHMGLELPPVKFCPWCGAKKP